MSVGYTLTLNRESRRRRTMGCNGLVVLCRVRGQVRQARARLFVAGIDLSTKKDLEIQIVKPDGRILKSQPTIEIRSVSDRFCIVDLTRCGSELRDFDAPLISITSEAIGLAVELPCRIKENVNDSREQTAIP